MTRAGRTGFTEHQSRAPDPSHPLPTGASVAVLRLSPGRPAIEGWAVITGIAPGRHRYEVRFIGERTTKRRLVHADYQSAPERMLELLLDWRADSTAFPDFHDFFPEDNV
jgi:hypothetical protein